MKKLRVGVFKRYKDGGDEKQNGIIIREEKEREYQLKKARVIKWKNGVRDQTRVLRARKGARRCD